MATIELTEKQRKVVEDELLNSNPMLYFLTGHLPFLLLQHLEQGLKLNKPIGSQLDRNEVVTALLFLLEASED